MPFVKKEAGSTETTETAQKRKGRLEPKKSDVVKRSVEEIEQEQIKIAKEQSEHPTRCLFDIFLCTGIKKKIMNKHTKKNEACIFGLQLETMRPNLKTTFIEPRNVYGGQGLRGFNESTRLCFDGFGPGTIYLAAGEFHEGDRITDLEYLREIKVIDESDATYEDFGYTLDQANKVFSRK